MQVPSLTCKEEAWVQSAVRTARLSNVSGKVITRRADEGPLLRYLGKVGEEERGEGGQLGRVRGRGVGVRGGGGERERERTCSGAEWPAFGNGAALLRRMLRSLV